MSACNTPSSALAAPKSSTTPPDHQAGGPIRSKTMRTKPYTATLVMTPLMSADTWLGAAGCASGNPTGSGPSPALDPGPSNVSAQTAEAIVVESSVLRISAKV